MTPTAPPEIASRPTPKATQAYTELRSNVEGVRSKHRLKFLITGLGLAFFIFGAAFLGFSLVDVLFKLTVTGRAFWLALGAGGAVGAAAICILKPWKKVSGGANQDPVAREIEHAYPELEEQLSTALEYGKNLDATTRDGASPELVGALVVQTQSRVALLNLSRTVNWRRALWAMALAFFCAGAVGIYAAASPRLFMATFSRFMNPAGSTPAPTLTVIKSVSPEGGEVPVEETVTVSAALDGLLPENATLSVWVGETPPTPEVAAANKDKTAPVEGHWEDRMMDKGAGAVYTATLRRLLDSTRFKIKAGDAESKEFTLDVFREPQIDEFTVKLDFPSYTGKAAETLPPGVGEIKALKGTKVTLQFKANTTIDSAAIPFGSGSQAPAHLEGGRKGEVSFLVDKDDSYSIALKDPKGRANRNPSSYKIQALNDNRPKVRIMKPDRDLMVHRSQKVDIEISASDDIGVGEMGIYHSLGKEEQKKMVRRLDPALPNATGKMSWDLGTLGLKGGEVIAYYAYALDNDTVGGPKVAKSEIHFLTVYDEEDYKNQDQPKPKKGQKTPESVKRLDKLISQQKKLLSETFATARSGEKDAETRPDPEKVKLEEKKRADKSTELAKSQRNLKNEVDKVVEEIEKDLKEQGKAEEKPEGEKTEEAPKPQLGAKEIELMKSSTERMDVAAVDLDGAKLNDAVTPEIEALRRLSETRRLLLSEEGDQRFKMSMERQSKKNKKQEQNQQQQDQQQAKEEMEKMPPMMEREKDIEREVEKLEARAQEKKNRDPNDPNETQKTDQAGTDEQKKQEEEKRKLQRKTEEQMRSLAKQNQESSEKLRDLAERNPALNKPADDLKNAAEKMEQAARSLAKPKEAKEQANQAQQDMKNAQRGIRDALQQQLRQELANLEKDAKDLTQKQQDLAQATQDQMQQQQKPGKENQQGQPQSNPQGKPESGQKPQAGQPQAGQPQAGQPQGGQPQEGQPQGGEPKPGEQQQKAMGGLGRQQQDIAEELKSMASRLDNLTERAEKEGLGGAPQLNQAKLQTQENAPAPRNAEQAANDLKQGNGEAAKENQQKAARALQNLEQSIQEARQKTEAADMQKLADAMKKTEQLAQEQGDLARQMAQKRDPAGVAAKQEKVAEGAKDLASKAANLDALKSQGRADSVRQKLEEAAQAGEKAKDALGGQETEKAQEQANAASKSLENALNEMNKAAGKTLEQRAKEAKAVATETREKQEAAAASAKEAADKLQAQAAGKPEAQQDPAGAQKAQQTAANEQQDAARQAKRLQKALEGLQEMAQAANPNAAEAAKEALNTSQEERVPQNMEELAQKLENLDAGKDDKEGKNAGTQQEKAEKKAATASEAGKKGEKLAATVKSIEKQLDQVMAEAKGDMVDKLNNMKDVAQETAQQAKNLAGQKPTNESAEQPGNQEGQGKKPTPESKNNPAKDPQASNKGNDPAGSPSDQAGEMLKELQKLEPKLQRVDPNAPELKQMKEAMDALKQAMNTPAKQPGKQPGKPSEPTEKPSEVTTPQGGENFNKVHKAMQGVASGLSERIERLIKNRDIHLQEGEEAPKEYRPLVEKYFRALSEDVEAEK